VRPPWGRPDPETASGAESWFHRKGDLGPPLKNAADWVALGKMALAGIPPAERYRAAFQERSASAVEGKLQVIGDYPSQSAARRACQNCVGIPLDWSPTSVPGLTGAMAADATGGSTAYAVLDRWTVPDDTVGR
jgi:hypothetical protein